MAAGPRGALAPRPKRIDLQAILRQATHPDEEAYGSSIDDIMHGLKELAEARKICAEADHFYDGDVGMVWASERVRAILEKQGVEDDLRDFNYAAIPVDLISNRLNISSVVAGIDDADEDEVNDTPGGTGAGHDALIKQANKQIAQLRKANELDAEEKRLHKSVSKHGTCYLLVWPVRDDNGKITGVDMRVNSAHNVIMIYDEEDHLKPRYALKSWDVEVDKKPAVRVNLYYPDRIERWTTEGGTDPKKEESWRKVSAAVEELDEDEAAELTRDEFTDPEGVEDGGRPLEPGDIPNPWKRVPFFHFRNDRPEGHPEHRNAYGPQQMINKLVYAHAGVIDYQSFPQRYVLADPTQDDPLQNVDDPDHPDDIDEDVETDTGHSGLRADPAELWRLWGKSTGEFQAADPRVFLDPLSAYKDAMADLTGLPRYAFGRGGNQLPSGEGAREMNGELNATIGDRQKRYDATWQDAYEFALMMFGITGVTVDVRWAPIERVNDLAGWQVVQAKINAGVPPQVALEESGYAPEQVEEWLKDANGADLGRRIALLNQIGTAVQTIGAGIALGAVSAPQAQAVIAGILGLTLEGTEIELPEPAEGDFVDPQAALKAQQEAQDKQLQTQQGMQKAQLDHATQTQQASQDHARTMAEEGHKRAREMFAEQQRAGGPPGNQQGGKSARRPGQPAGRR